VEAPINEIPENIRPARRVGDQGLEGGIAGFVRLIRQWIPTSGELGE
jgi:hypothetical protein